MRTLWRYCLAGLLILIPAWATFFVLSALRSTVTRVSGGLPWQIGVKATPIIGALCCILLVLSVGVLATHVGGKQILAAAEHWIQRIPLVRSIYLTIKGMTDLLQFRSRFGRSTVVAYPFPRDGLWAIGFVMGTAPSALQVAPATNLLMVFVPTAIHPFTGFLAFVPQPQ